MSYTVTNRWRNVHCAAGAGQFGASVFEKRTTPDTLAMGLAAWMAEKLWSWS